MSVIWALFIQFYVEKDLVQVGNNKADGEKPDLFFLSRVPLMKVTCLMCQVTWEQHMMHPVCHRTQGRLSGCSISQPAVKASFPRMFACWELLEKLMRCVFQLLVTWIPSVLHHIVKLQLSPMKTSHMITSVKSKMAFNILRQGSPALSQSTHHQWI